MSPEEFATTENLINEFIKPGGDGEKLQKKLLERAAKKENWVRITFNNLVYPQPVIIFLL